MAPNRGRGHARCCERLSRPSSPWAGKGAACRSGIRIPEGTMGGNEGEGGIFQQVGSMFSSLFGGKLSAGQRLEVEVMFGLIGYLAKADGLITSYESEFTNKMMDQLKLTLDGRAEALSAFDQGRQAGFDPMPEIARFTEVHPSGSEASERMFEVLLKL